MASLAATKARILERNFFRPAWYSIFVNPYFIGRFTLYRAIKDFAAHGTDEDTVLDIGCGIKPYRSLFRTPSYTGIDIEGGGHADDGKTVDRFYDGKTVPFPDASFTVTICTQVLEHATDPGAVIQEASRVLAPGGMAFFTMPFLYPEHEVPFDFQRFTRFQHARLMEAAGFVDIRIRPTTGFFGASSQLFVVTCFESFTFRASVLKALLTVLVFAPVQACGLLLDFLLRKPGPTLDYVITARKP